MNTKDDPTHIRENIPKSETTFSVQTRHWHGCSTSHGLPTSNWMHRCITMITSRMHIHLILMRPNSRQSTPNRKAISLQANCLTILCRSDCRFQRTGLCRFVEVRMEPSFQERYQQSESRRAMERNRQCGRRRVLSESFAGSQRVSSPFLLGLSIYAQCFVVCGRKPVGTCRQHHAEADGGIALGESVHQRNAIRQVEHTVATFQRQMAAERKHSDSGGWGVTEKLPFVLCALSPTGVSGYSDFRSLIQ